MNIDTYDVEIREVRVDDDNIILIKKNNGKVEVKELAYASIGTTWQKVHDNIRNKYFSLDVAFLFKGTMVYCVMSNFGMVVHRLLSGYQKIGEAIEIQIEIGSKTVSFATFTINTMEQLLQVRPITIIICLYMISQHVKQKKMNILSIQIQQQQSHS